MNCSKKSQGGNSTKPRGTVRIEPTQMRWFLGQSGDEAGPQRHSKALNNKAKLKGDHQARVHSD
jgi:hypothetical protein